MSLAVKIPMSRPDEPDMSPYDPDIQAISGQYT